MKTLWGRDQVGIEAFIILVVVVLIIGVVLVVKNG